MDEFKMQGESYQEWLLRLYAEVATIPSVQVAAVEVRVPAQALDPLPYPTPWPRSKSPYRRAA